jgi:hypothetical protein
VRDEHDFANEAKLPEQIEPILAAETPAVSSDLQRRTAQQSMNTHRLAGGRFLPVFDFVGRPAQELSLPFFTHRIFFRWSSLGFRFLFFYSGFEATPSLSLLRITAAVLREV